MTTPDLAKFSADVQDFIAKNLTPDLTKAASLGFGISRADGERWHKAVYNQGWIAPDALIIWEEGSDVSPPDGFSILDQRKFGDTQATFLRYTE